MSIAKLTTTGRTLPDLNPEWAVGASAKLVVTYSGHDQWLASKAVIAAALDALDALGLTSTQLSSLNELAAEL